MACRLTDSTTFRATMPPILSALKVSGDGGARLQLDIPECDLPDVLRLLAWRERVLVVTVVPEGDGKQPDRSRKLHI